MNNIKKLRLIFRNGVADSDGKLAGYEYGTYIVEIPSDEPVLDTGYDSELPEVIGGEWLGSDGNKRERL